MNKKFLFLLFSLLVPFAVHSQAVPSYCRGFNSSPNAGEFCSVANADGDVDQICGCALDWQNYYATSVYQYCTSQCHGNELCDNGCENTWSNAILKNNDNYASCGTWLDDEISFYPADCEEDCTDDPCDAAVGVKKAKPHMLSPLYAPLLEKYLQNEDTEFKRLTLSYK